MRPFAGIFVGAFLVAKTTAQNDKPGPLVIPGSQYFEGNDGPWSTFDIRVGTPEQFIRVLPSTASPHTLVPLAELACSREAFGTVPPDCAVSRGNLFDLNESSSWEGVGTYGINRDGVGLGAHLGYDVAVQFGFEKLGLGLNGPDFEGQTVGAIAAPEPFYLGIFGLSNQPMNFTSLGNTSSPSFLTTLKDKRMIPSFSYSYTAGARYRLKQVYGQLVFSGYDTSRFRENSVSFSLAEDITRDLVVVVQSISYSGSNSATLLSDPVEMFIDSTDPNIWLPDEACRAFEEAFGLRLDQESGLYLVNETHRNRLLDSDAQVSFRLSDVRSGGDTVTIVLPYAAFDLTVEAPLVANSSHYFPLRRANSSSQYTLGRTFLQEAYLSVDYERKTFNVSSCVWNQGAEENIVAITSPDDPNADLDPSSSSSSSSGFGGGAIAGIVVGAILGVALIAGAIALCFLRKRRKWIGSTYAGAAKEPEPDESVLKGPVFNSPSFRHASESTQNGSSSVPFSAADVSGARSTPTTADHSQTGSGPSPALAMGVSPNDTGTSGGTVELDGDGTAVKPHTELDGKEVQKPLPSVAENPSGVFELPGVKAGADSGSKAMEPQHHHRAPSTVGSLPSADDGRDRTPSPLTSVVGPNWRPGRVSIVEPDPVSPDTPVRRHSERPF
ncbi:aspartic peptidase domain-containing protein [Triangularia verruculosa]|uniref:Aspartic peptidase domain-containing protein n=1 Tax=Triangularia verruculosa TaxID=2587418 RepID=A0AAN6XF54_9PEZI|nr:aspartic peptidase domain-containing protein [Triangularia verruculosa]